MEENKKTIEDKLSTVKYNCGKETHLKVNMLECRKCENRVCTYICPANVYKVDNYQLTVEFENCLECGACKIACPRGAINWEYPPSGKGVVFKNS